MVRIPKIVENSEVFPTVIPPNEEPMINLVLLLFITTLESNNFNLPFAVLITVSLPSI